MTPAADSVAVMGQSWSGASSAIDSGINRDSSWCLFEASNLSNLNPIVIFFKSLELNFNFVDFGYVFLGDFS